jgi:hypothetical protein
VGFEVRNSRQVLVLPLPLTPFRVLFSADPEPANFLIDLKAVEILFQLLKTPLDDRFKVLLTRSVRLGDELFAHSFLPLSCSGTLLRVPGESFHRL